MSPYQPAWGEDHAKFLEALRSAYDPNDQEALPNVERRAYAVAPRSLPPDEHHDYRNRAANRGRHRAMLQAALRALATNAEQHHRREQAAGVLDLVPRPLKEPASPPARPAPAVPTYRLTRAKILVRQDQERLEKLLLAKKSSARLLDGWQQDVFAKSFASVSLLQLSLVKAEMILNRTAEWIERQRAALVNNTHRYSWSIRSRVAAVIEAIDRGLAMPALDLTSYSWISRSELAPLTIIRSAPFKDVPFTRLVGMAQNAGQLIRKIQRRLAEADSIYRTRVAHVEQARIALRALRQEVHDCSLLADPTLASVLQLAVPLYHGVMPLQGDLAAKVVRCEVVKEVIKCAGSSPIDLAQAWSFTASIPKRARGKRWFYLEKWPVQPNGAQGTRSGQSTGSSNLSSLSSGSLGGAVPMSVDERADSPVEAAPPKEGPEDVNVAAGWEALADAWGPRITEVPPLGDTPGAAVPLEMPIFDNDQAVVDRGSEKDVNGFMPTTLPRRRRTARPAPLPVASEDEAEKPQPRRKNRAVRLADTTKNRTVRPAPRSVTSEDEAEMPPPRRKNRPVRPAPLSVTSEDEAEKPQHRRKNRTVRLAGTTKNRPVRPAPRSVTSEDEAKMPQPRRKNRTVRLAGTTKNRPVRPAPRSVTSEDEAEMPRPQRKNGTVRTKNRTVRPAPLSMTSEDETEKPPPRRKNRGVRLAGTTRERASRPRDNSGA